MSTAMLRRIWWGLTVTLAALVTVATPQSTVQVSAAVPESGIVCAAGAPNFTLTATMGTVGTPDGNTITMWSYAQSGGMFQLPGPTLCVNQGDTVNVTLVNNLPEASSIVFPGQVNVLANGSPAQPQFSTPGDLTSLTSLTNTAATGGGSVTYTFTADQPGTYLYESGTDSDKQVQMGLYGALVVRPSGHASWAYTRADTAFNPSTEYIMLLSEVDPDLHLAVERGEPYDITRYHPRYWMINGRSFPDTIAPNGAPWLPFQPYSALVHMTVNDATHQLPALVRYLNVGSLNHPFHPHGNHGRVIARDGRLLQSSGGQDLSYDKFLVLVGAGQTWDAEYTWFQEYADFRDQRGQGWNPTTKPIPPLPQQLNLIFKDNDTWFSGSGYLGSKCDLPTGVTSHNDIGEYYQVWHSHALNEVANYEAGFGGMLTLQRIDPPASMLNHPCN